MPPLALRSKDAVNTGDVLPVVAFKSWSSAAYSEFAFHAKSVSVEGSTMSISMAAGGKRTSVTLPVGV